MKRFASLLLILCMLFALPALAASNNDRFVGLWTMNKITLVGSDQEISSSGSGFTMDLAPDGSCVFVTDRNTFTNYKWSYVYNHLVLAYEDDILVFEPVEDALVLSSDDISFHFFRSTAAGTVPEQDASDGDDGADAFVGIWKAYDRTFDGRANSFSSNEESFATITEDKLRIAMLSDRMVDGVMVYDIEYTDGMGYVYTDDADNGQIALQLHDDGSLTMETETEGGTSVVYFKKHAPLPAARRSDAGPEDYAGSWEPQYYASNGALVPSESAQMEISITIDGAKMRGDTTDNGKPVSFSFDISFEDGSAAIYGTQSEEAVFRLYLLEDGWLYMESDSVCVYFS